MRNNNNFEKADYYKRVILPRYSPFLLMGSRVSHNGFKFRQRSSNLNKGGKYLFIVISSGEILTMHNSINNN